MKHKISSAANPVCDIFKETLIYYNNEPEIFKKALHNVLFYNITNQGTHLAEPHIQLQICSILIQ